MNFKFVTWLCGSYFVLLSAYDLNSYFLVRKYVFFTIFSALNVSRQAVKNSPLRLQGGIKDSSHFMATSR